MNKDKVFEVCKKYDLKPSSQFIEMALKFNSERLLEEFCNYWKNKRGIGGGDLIGYFSQYYKGDLK